MATRLQGAHVAIVGLGMMGGSLAGALRGRCSRVTGVARRAATVEAALVRGLVDSGTTDLAEGLRQADIVVLAMPVRAILRRLAEIGRLVPAGCLVLDLGSTKVQIVGEMARLPEHVEPVGGHPMCGRELAGLDAADPALFSGRTFILTPLERTSKAALALACELAQASGADPLVLEPERQDRLAATLSHLPYLLACALVSTARAATSADPAARKIPAGGYRDVSRLAGSDVTMWTDILLTNRAEVLRALDAFQVQLGELHRLVEAADESSLRATLTSVRAERMRMYT